MTVDDFRCLAGNGDVCKQPRYQPGTDGNAIDRGNNRLVAVDDVVDEVAGFLPCLHARHLVVHVRFDHAEIATRGKRLALAGQDDGTDIRVIIDVTPYIGELLVAFGIQRVIGLGLVQGDAKNPVSRPVELELGVPGVTVGHLVSFLILIR